MTTIAKKLRGKGIAHEPGAPTLTLENVTVAYVSGASSRALRRVNGTAETPHALENITFEVFRGERVAIVGPNGAGKSTLLKLIAGVLRPTEGEVRVFGHGPAGHICIGYVPQRSQIDWSFPVTVEDVVMMGRVGQIGLFRWPRRQDWAVVRQALARVNASHLAGKQIGELSGGQQQRVFIARALAQEAELLLLDEPLAGLDAPSREAIFQILDSLRPDGVTVLMATHDLNVAAERFERVMLLNRRVVALGPGTAVLTPDHLLQAYGGHVQFMGEGANTMILADTCCDHGELPLNKRG
ncbi:MAG: metal ABC transporter ATP-binding protein [Chloroflexi bacterium]|nr:MAG: metal ABC transporter ATP-binding protein [Chloroflexota bacterium]